MELIEAINTNKGNNMSKLTEVQKLQKELDEMHTKFSSTKAANTVVWDGPTSKRNTHTYHKGVSLRSLV